jgi:hypothetical protein
MPTCTSLLPQSTPTRRERGARTFGRGWHPFATSTDVRSPWSVTIADQPTRHQGIRSYQAGARVGGSTPARRALTAACPCAAPFAVTAQGRSGATTVERRVTGVALRASQASSRAVHQQPRPDLPPQQGRTRERRGKAGERRQNLCPLLPLDAESARISGSTKAGGSRLGSEEGCAPMHGTARLWVARRYAAWPPTGVRNRDAR